MRTQYAAVGVTERYNESLELFARVLAPGLRFSAEWFAAQPQSNRHRQDGGGVTGRLLQETTHPRQLAGDSMPFTLTFS